MARQTKSRQLSYSDKLSRLGWAGIYRFWPLDDTKLSPQQKSSITKLWAIHETRASKIYLAAQRQAEAYERAVKKATKKKLKKKKRKVKKKPKKVVVEECGFAKIFETIVIGFDGHYNVNVEFLNGNRKLSDYCLAELLYNQIDRKAKMFRFWYRVDSTPAYPEGLQSTGVIDKSVLLFLPGGKPRPGGILHFLKKLPGPVAYYWFRVEGYKRLEVGAHGELKNEYK